MKKIYKVAKISPSISTENLGDYIIEDYCNNVCRELFGEHLSLSIPTREHLSRLTRRKVATSDFSFVCGSNLLSSNMRTWKQWNISLLDAFLIKYGDVRKIDLLKCDIQKIKKGAERNHVILLGAGWLEYQKEPTCYTKNLLRTVLDRNYIHSVRDSYTQKMLKSIGIDNVINTACPTMWNLTTKLCENIPQEMSEAVVTTLTDYRVDKEKDKRIIEILLNRYKEVYIWLQSLQDYAYLHELGSIDKVKIIPPTLEAYDSLLETKNIDYVGTRLHGGIRALNHMKRSCIIAVDNRAIEISKDTGLPTIIRTNIEDELDNWIMGNYVTDIKIPLENIKKWKSQFTWEK